MKKYIVSRCSNANFLLAEADLEEVTNEENDAHRVAEGLTRSTGEPHYVWEVDLTCVKGFRQTKSVEGFRVGPPK